jgi:hypothetical protein
MIRRIKNPRLGPAAALVFGFAGTPALAQQGDVTERRPTAVRQQDDFSLPDQGKPSRFETDSENIFGFTEGTDTPAQGEREISLEGIGRFGKRRFSPPPRTVPDTGAPIRGPALGDDDDDPPPAAAAPARAAADDDRAQGPAGRPRYRAVNGKLGYQLGVTDDLSLELGLFGDARSVRNVPDLPNKSFAAFDGLSIELKYRIVERTQDNPFGFAVKLEPRYARIDELEGRGQNALSAEAMLLFDMRVIPDRLWFASNLAVEPGAGWLRGTGAMERDSMLSWSNAFSVRVAETTFLGAEARYFRAYEGLALNRLLGDALFLGPTLHHRLSKSTSISFAYSGQVAGRDRTPGFAGHALDLTHFARHQLRLKVGMEF